MMRRGKNEKEEKEEEEVEEEEEETEEQWKMLTCTDINDYVPLTIASSAV